MKDIAKIATDEKFEICTQVFDRKDENIIGYVYVGERRLIVISESYIKQQRYNVRYIIALAIAYYNNAINKDDFYQEIHSNIIDDNIVSDAIDILVSDKTFKHAIFFNNNDIEKLSNKFRVPKWIVEKKVINYNVQNNEKKLILKNNLTSLK